MRRVFALGIIVSACGRVGFEPTRSGDGDGAPGDQGIVDVSSAVCTTTAAELFSPCGSTHSFEGAYFDVVAQSALGITAFETMTQSCGTFDVSIYYRSGTHVGFENNPAAWTLVGTTAGFTPACAASCPITPTLFPIAMCVAIPQGQRYAFYIAISAGNGSFEFDNATLGSVVVADGAIQLLAGRTSQGTGAFTGTIVEGKSFQGIIHYAR